MSATDLTVSEILLLSKISDNVYLFGRMFLTDILTVHVCFVYLFQRNEYLEIVHFLCIERSKRDKSSVLIMGTLRAMSQESILGSCNTPP